MELTRIEYETRLAELQNQLAELKSANIIDKSWEPQKHEKYWFINSAGDVLDTSWEDWEADRGRRIFGNVFTSEEDAKFVRDTLRVWTELRKFAEPETRTWDGYKLHYRIACDCNYGKPSNIVINHTSFNKGAELYFESEERAKEAIKVVGADRIKKYYLGIKE